VNNPADVLDPDGRVVFPKGSISLKADRLLQFLSSTSPTENSAVHAARAEAFWKAWLTQESGATDGEAQGIDHVVSTLADSDLMYLTLPVTPLAVSAGQPVQVRLAEGVTGASAIAPIVPLPEGAPGRRPRLRVLDGTGQLDAARGAAVLLAAGGAQVDVIGNARAFGAPVTQIVYYDTTQRDAAEKMRALLGVGEIVQSTQTNSALDLMITLGADYLDRSAAPSTEVTGA
jgi:hypothetical protein